MLSKCFDKDIVSEAKAMARPHLTGLVHGSFHPEAFQRVFLEFKFLVVE